MKKKKPVSYHTQRNDSVSYHTKPTLDQYGQYQAAYDYFNKVLFDGKLKPCLLTFSTGGKRTKGFFSAGRWHSDGERTHEIALCRDYLSRPFVDVMSTLVHEMVHQWQADEGTPSRGRYHNMEWAVKMIDIGLTPSDTGEPGGKMVGQQMTHYVEADGPFAVAIENMPDEIKLPWLTGAEEKKPTAKTANKTAYRCGCKNKIWGKPGLTVTCGECNSVFVAN